MAATGPWHGLILYKAAACQQGEPSGNMDMCNLFTLCIPGLIHHAFSPASEPLLSCTPGCALQQRLAEAASCGLQPLL